MYDLANQSFTLLIITLLFGPYFKNIVVGDETRGDSLWSIIAATSLALTVIASPILGAIADHRRTKKKYLLGAGVVCSLLTCGLALTGTGTVWLAALLFIPANIAYNLGSNFMASFLPTLATQRNMGRVSAIGWSMGYIGALLLLGITLGVMILFDRQAKEGWQPFFVFAGLWYAINMLPSALVLREPEGDSAPVEGGTLAGAAFRRLAHTARRATHFKQLFRFLVAFLVSSFGVQAMIKFAAVLAEDFGIKETGLVVFITQLTVTAVITAIATARFQDRIGARATVVIYNIVWLVSCLALFGVTIAWPHDKPQWVFWVIGNGIGIGLGGIGTASRAMVGRFSPRARTAEFFGLWGLTYTLAGAIGVLAFGQVKAWVGAWWAGLELFGDSNTPALALLAAFFVAGLLLVLRVNETAGVRAARREDRDATRQRGTLAS